MFCFTILFFCIYSYLFGNLLHCDAKSDIVRSRSISNTSQTYEVNLYFYNQPNISCYEDNDATIYRLYNNLCSPIITPLGQVYYVNIQCNSNNYLYSSLNSLQLYSDVACQHLLFTFSNNLIDHCAIYHDYSMSVSCSVDEYDVNSNALTMIVGIIVGIGCGGCCCGALFYWFYIRYSYKVIPINQADDINSHDNKDLLSKPIFSVETKNLSTDHVLNLPDVSKDKQETNQYLLISKDSLTFDCV